MGDDMRWVSVALIVTGLLIPPSRGADDLPSRAVARLGSHAFYHGPGIECAVLSPDGQRAASAARTSAYFRHGTAEDRDNYDRLVVWDAATGERLREITAPAAPVVSLAFSPDGKRLAVGCGTSLEARVVMFEAESGKFVREFRRALDTVRRLHFSPFGDRLVASYASQGVMTWDVDGGKGINFETPPLGIADGVQDNEEILDAVPSADGEMIGWLVWKPPDRSKLLPSALAIPGPRTLIVTAKGTQKPLHRTDFEGQRLDTFAFSADGKMFFVRGATLSAHDTTTGKELFQLAVKWPHRIAPSPDGRLLLTPTGQSQVQLWDVQTRKLLHEHSPGFGYGSSRTPRTPQILSADGKTLLLATDSTLRPFDTVTGKERRVPGHRARVVPRFSADGKTLVTICDERRNEWDLLPGKTPALASEERRTTWDGGRGDWPIAHSADGRLFLEGRYPVRVRESSSGRVVCELEDAHGISSGSFSPDGSRVLLDRWQSPEGDHHRLDLHDARTGKWCGRIKVVDFLSPATFSPDGRFVACADRRNAVSLFDGATGKLLRTLGSSRPLPWAACEVAKVVFSQDGGLLFAFQYRRVRDDMGGRDDRWEALPSRVFHVRTGRELHCFYDDPELRNEARVVSRVACSPDNRLLAVAREESGTIRVIEIASGKVRVEFNGHHHGVHGMEFSPDGRTLASGGVDNVVFLWDVTGARTQVAAKKLTELELTAAWADLASDDGKRAGEALAALVRFPRQSVTLLNERLRPTAALDEKELMGLIADLDADEFERREAASQQLALLGDAAEPALRRALKGAPPLEVGRRLGTLLDRLESGALPPETLREVRAVEALEHLGTPEAVKCLESLASGASAARLTRNAKATLDRLARGH